jgi:hypothetical protein
MSLRRCRRTHNMREVDLWAAEATGSRGGSSPPGPHHAVASGERSIVVDTVATYPLMGVRRSMVDRVGRRGFTHGGVMVEPGKRRWMVAVMLALTAGCSNTADQAMPAVDPFEEPLVADGIVTDAEYEQAVRAEASCVAEALDVEIEGPRWLADGSRYEYQYVVTGRRRTTSGPSRWRLRAMRSIATPSAGSGPVSETEERSLRTAQRRVGRVVGLPGVRVVPRVMDSASALFAPAAQDRAGQLGQPRLTPDRVRVRPLPIQLMAASPVYRPGSSAPAPTEGGKARPHGDARRV